MNRTSTPASLPKIKSALRSIELQNWLLEEWDKQLIIKISANITVLRELATKIIEQLSKSLSIDSKDRQAVQYDDEKIAILIGIDCDRWSVFTTTKEKSTDFTIATEASKEYSLLSESGKAHG